LFCTINLCVRLPSAYNLILPGGWWTVCSRLSLICAVGLCIFPALS
jgi:hypothetical protein